MTARVEEAGKPARYWALPVASLSFLLLVGARLEGKSVLLLPAGLMLIASARIWTNSGKRRFFALDQFFGNRGRPTPGFWLSLLLTAALLAGVIFNTIEHLDRVSNLAGASTPAAEASRSATQKPPGYVSLEDSELPGINDPYWDKLDDMREVLFEIDAQMEGIAALLADPDLGDEKHSEIMHRLDLMEQANTDAGCKLLGMQQGHCGSFDRVDYMTNKQEWNRIYDRIIDDAEIFLAPL